MNIKLCRVIILFLVIFLGHNGILASSQTGQTVHLPAQYQMCVESEEGQEEEEETEEDDEPDCD